MWEFKMEKGDDNVSMYFSALSFSNSTSTSPHFAPSPRSPHYSGLSKVLRINIPFFPAVRTYQAPLFIGFADHGYNFIMCRFSDNFLISTRSLSDIQIGGLRGHFSLGSGSR